MRLFVSDVVRSLLEGRRYFSTRCLESPRPRGRTTASERAGVGAHMRGSFIAVLVLAAPILGAQQPGGATGGGYEIPNPTYVTIARDPARVAADAGGPAAGDPRIARMCPRTR